MPASNIPRRPAFRAPGNGATWNHRCVKPLGPGSGHAGDATAGASPDGALYAVCQDYSVSQVRISHTKATGKYLAKPEKAGKTEGK